jgi:hypothetical protein
MSQPRLRLPDGYQLPAPPAPSLTPAHFMPWPIALLQGLTTPELAWQSAVYQIAFQQAQAWAQPSLPERDLLAVWN